MKSLSNFKQLFKSAAEKMNKHILVLCLLLAVSIHAGCASSKTVFNTPQQIIGEIMVIGNEPFTKLAVRVDGGKTYLINCSDELRKSLLSHQGKITEIFYNEIEKKNSGDEITVTKINLLSK
jgi:ABC-type sulfate transport system substrate-binding protein